MKKKIICTSAVLLLLILVVLGILLLKRDSTSTITFYQTSCKFDEIRNSQAIQIGDLNIQLTDFFLNAQYPDDLENISENEKNPYSCSQRLKFSISTDIQSVIYDWIVYDNNGNILATNLPTTIRNKEYKKQNEFLKYINKTIFNSTDMQEYSHRVIGNSVTNTIVHTDNSVQNTLISSIVGIKENEEYKNDFEQVHILIINPKYQEYGNKKYIEFNDTVAEFIIKS